mmetsp:Transcript_4505/g.14901  ORF Transcript_4505/g.14901 Transcript_4505/m.14901 type:complete len:92 (+) Transcript_4505:1748-2023(+)
MRENAPFSHKVFQHHCHRRKSWRDVPGVSAEVTIQPPELSCTPSHHSSPPCTPTFFTFLYTMTIYEACSCTYHRVRFIISLGMAILLDSSL